MKISDEILQFWKTGGYWKDLRQRKKEVAENEEYHREDERTMSEERSEKDGGVLK